MSCTLIPAITTGRLGAEHLPFHGRLIGRPAQRYSRTRVGCQQGRMGSLRVWCSIEVEDTAQRKTVQPMNILWMCLTARLRIGVWALLATRETDSGALVKLGVSSEARAHQPQQPHQPIMAVDVLAASTGGAWGVLPANHAPRSFARRRRLSRSLRPRFL